MTKIKSLTTEQEQQLPVDREAFRAIGIRTGHDLTCVVEGNAAILAARREVGAPPPRAILWARSTAEALRWVYTLKRLDPRAEKKPPTGTDLRAGWNQWSWGQTEQYWLGRYRFAISRVGVKVTPEQERRLATREQLAKSCYGVITVNAVEIAIQHPRVAAFDDRQRLHRIDGPALEFADGYAVYAVHGIRLTPELGEAMAKRTLTATQIRDGANAEVRRVLVGVYNQGDTGRYLRDIGATVIHEDMVEIAGNDGSYFDLETNTLEQGVPLAPVTVRRRLLRIEQPGDEPFVAIEVTNSTPEPDGTRKIYTFRCDPNLRPLPIAGIRGEYGEPQAMACQNAIASTYGYTGEEYKLELET